MKVAINGEILEVSGGGGSPGDSSSEEIYSTDEARVGTWIDGKPLYRKTFAGDNIHDKMVLLHGVQMVVHSYGFFYGLTADAAKVFWPFPLYIGTQGQSIPVILNNGDLIVSATSNNVGYSYHFTVEYTKITD